MDLEYRYGHRYRRGTARNTKPRTKRPRLEEMKLKQYYGFKTSLVLVPPNRIS